ncbi:phosphotransferase [Nocardiopsis coralliicola]
MSRTISEIPTGPVEVPAVVRALAGSARTEPVWINELGGTTFRLTGDGPDRYLKWTPAGTPEIDLAAEAERLAWAQQWVRVPEVLGRGADPAGTWLVTAALQGSSAVDPRWRDHPVTAGTAIGHGLRRLHDALPVAECPFDWSIERRLRRCDERLAAPGGIPDEDLSPEHRGLDPAAVRARLAAPPPADRLVVCHGDACAPNTLLDPAGGFAGHVDLGSLGTADRWADLAVAAWSMDWNYGSGYTEAVYAGYGIEADPERIAYYRLLWDFA